MHHKLRQPVAILNEWTTEILKDNVGLWFGYLFMQRWKTAVNMLLRLFYSFPACLEENKGRVCVHFVRNDLVLVS